MARLAALVLALSGQQYDFVWGTTILSTDAFVQLTQGLGVLPSALGFAVPSEQAIVSSMQGADPQALSALRGDWAFFILACISAYAILPRLILWLWSSAMLAAAKRQVKPDWEHPYFYTLRARLLPSSGSVGIVDHDQNPSATASPHAVDNQAFSNSIDKLALPSHAYVGAFEWADDSLPKAPIANAVELGPINDVNAQTGVLQAVTQSPSASIIFVNLQRSADRGAARFLKQLNTAGELHLIVLRRAMSDSDPAPLRWLASIGRAD